MPITNVRNKIYFEQYYLMQLCCVFVPFGLILREITHVWRTCIVRRLKNIYSLEVAQIC